MIRTKSCRCVMLRVTSLSIRLTILETYNYFPLNMHIELSPPLSSNIHTNRTFIGRNMTQCAAHVCIVIIRRSKRSSLKLICVQGCICRSILILFLQLNPREYNFPKLILFWQLNLVRFIQNNSYCNNLTL
jgi:hypothetical protein